MKTNIFHMCNCGKPMLLNYTPYISFFGDMFQTRHFFNSVRSGNNGPPHCILTQSRWRDGTEPEAHEASSLPSTVRQQDIGQETSAVFCRGAEGHLLQCKSSHQEKKRSDREVCANRPNSPDNPQYMYCLLT